MQKSLKKISRKVGKRLETEKKKCKNYFIFVPVLLAIYLFSTLCSFFTVFTIKLLHEKLEDNEFPHTAQQQRT